MLGEKLRKFATSLKREVVITSPKGLHGRPAASIVKIASRYDCEVAVEMDRQRVSGKSLICLMTLGAPCGSKLILEGEGTESSNVLDELEALVKADFVENEPER